MVVKRLPRETAVDRPGFLSAARLEQPFLLSAAMVVVTLWSLSVLPAHMVWIGAGLGWWLVVLSVLDLRQWWLPDLLTLPLLLAGLALVWVLQPDALLAHLIGAAIGWGGLLVVAFLFRWARGFDGLGQGDAKLFGAAGAWLGYAGLPGVLLIGSVLALAAAVLVRRSAIPFGPFLAAGFWITWLYGPLLLR